MTIAPVYLWTTIFGYMTPDEKAFLWGSLLYSHLLITTFMWAFSSCSLGKSQNSKQLTETMNTGSIDGEIMVQKDLNKRLEPEPFIMEDVTHQMLVVLMLSSFLTPIVPGVNWVNLCIGITYYCLMNFDMKNKGVDKMYSKDHSLFFGKMFLAGSIVHIAGIIVQQNFENAETGIWIIPNILMYILLAVCLLWVLPFELCVTCCVGNNEKSPPSDYSQRTRKIRTKEPNAWVEKHKKSPEWIQRTQKPMIVHPSRVVNQIAHPKPEIRNPPKQMVGIFKEITKPPTLVEKDLRGSYLHLIGSDYDTPKKQEDSPEKTEWKSHWTPEGWRQVLDLGKAKDRDGKVKGRADDLSKSNFRLNRGDVEERARAQPKEAQLTTKSFITGNQLGVGKNKFNFDHNLPKSTMAQSMVPQSNYNSVPVGNNNNPVTQTVWLGGGDVNMHGTDKDGNVNKDQDRGKPMMN